MATHSIIPAWRNPWTEEPGRLQSMGSPRVGYGWVIFTSLSHIVYNCIEYSRKLWINIPYSLFTKRKCVLTDYLD